MQYCRLRKVQLSLFGKLLLTLVFLFCFLGSNSVKAQDKIYGLTQQIQKPSEFFKDIRSQWAGREIVFIKQEKSESLGKYLGFCTDPTDPHHSVIDYFDLVDKRGKIDEVWWGIVGQSNILGNTDKSVFFWKINIEDGRTVWYHERGESYIDGVGFVDVHRRARLDVGKTFWAWKIANLFELNDAATVRLRNLEEIRLVDVRWSEQSNYPFRYIFRTNRGKVGYRSYNDVIEFQNDWLASDPRTQYKGWSALQWLSIENRKLMVGMTPEMVRLAWGEPVATDRVVRPGGKQVFLWIFIGVNKHVECLFFLNGILVFWQNQQALNERQDDLQFTINQSRLKTSCTVEIDWIKQARGEKNFVTFQW